MSTHSSAAAAPGHPDSGSQSLWSSFAQSVRDNVIGEVAVQALRFGGLIVLARALKPGDFGLFRVLVVVSAFAMLVNESGIPDALIQRKTLTTTHIATAWYLSLALASVSAGTLYLAAPAIARIMEMPALTTGVRLLCLPILFEGTAVTANARLRRGLRFGALAAADVAGEAAFLVLALGTLWMGDPRLSLPIGLGGRFVFHAAATWIADPYVPREWPRAEAARDFARFSSSVLGGRFVVALSSNADFLLVGRLLGSSALGFYSMAWDLLRFIPDRLYRVVGRVTLPAFCRLQDDDARLARAYRDFFGHISRIVVPLVVCVCIAAPELIGTVYGSKWIPAALPMRLLAPGLILLGLRVGIGSIYYTKDHPSFDIYLHSVRLVLIILAVTSTASFGLVAVSAGMSVVEGVISIGGQWMACVLIGLSIYSLAEAAMPAAILTIMCAMATLAGKGLATALDVRGPLAIAAMIIPPGLVFLWREAEEVREMAGRAFGENKPAPIKLSEEQA